MKEVTLICPKCKRSFYFNNYWHWVLKSPFHWLWWDKNTKRVRDYRLTKCKWCDKKIYMKREK